MRIIRRPLLWFAVMFLLGLLAAAGYRVIVVWGIIICIFAGVIGNSLCKIEWYMIGAAILMFVAGYVRMKYFEMPKEAFGYMNEAKEACVQGVVDDISYGWQTLVVLDEAFVIDGDEEMSLGKVMVYCSEEAEVSLGDIIAVNGDLSSFDKPHNDGEFNAYEYYKSQGIYYVLKSGEGDSLNIVSEAGYLVEQQLLGLRDKLKDKVFRNSYDRDDAGVIIAMLLGDKDYLNEDTELLFQDAGVSHILVVSGLHISLLGMGLFKLLRKISGYGISCSIASVFMILYVIMTGFATSGVRALIMFLVNMLAMYLGRTYDMISSMALALVMILLGQPFAFLSVGFLLSFSAVLGIAIILPVLEDVCRWAFAGRKLSQLMLMFAIGMATVPISTAGFYDYPLYTVVTNLIIVPCMPLLMVLGMIGCAVEIVLKGPAHLIIAFCEKVCYIGESLPYNRVLIGKPEFGKILVVYSVLVFMALIHLIIKALHKRNIRVITGIKVHLGKVQKILTAVILLMVLFVGELVFLSFHQSEELTITMLDVGQGDCCYVETKSGANVLIDSGSSDVYSLYEKRLLPFLESRAVSAIDYVIVTHGDTDHYSAIRDMLEAGVDETSVEIAGKSMDETSAGTSVSKGKSLIKHLVIPKLSTVDSELEELVALAKASGIEVLRLTKGDRIILEDVVMEILSPEEGTQAEGADKNENSLVVGLTYKDFDMLFTGDIGEEKERELIQSLREYDILKVAHHGSGYSTSQIFLETVKPKISLISCGINNSYGHPHEDCIERLTDIGSDIYITSEHRQIRIYTDGKDCYRVETNRQ
ncbi:MAG: DNA internalization-related competence protein ComEC/Rec2 [Lachnospiraceae bacterium]|nr:DNA internalization-related competence protein ComEC/Rec2 [Lachnospiraceae bacterium]